VKQKQKCPSLRLLKHIVTHYTMAHPLRLCCFAAKTS